MFIFFILLTIVVAVELECWPSTFKNGDTLRISWRGVEGASAADRIDIWMPDDKHRPTIGFLNISTSSSDGSTSLPLVNMRHSYLFGYYSHSARSIVGECRVSPIQPSEPTSVRLSMDRNATVMRVTWTTTAEGASDAFARVQWGDVAEKLVHSCAVDIRKTYKINEMCEAPANESFHFLDPGVFVSALMHGLSPETRYYYRVGSDKYGWSAVYSFISMPATASSSTAGVAFLFGDLGTYPAYTPGDRRIAQPNSIQTTNRIYEQIKALSSSGDVPIMLHHVGDISYARGYAHLWESFQSQVALISAICPYHVSIGNHEFDWPGEKWNPSWFSHYEEDDR